MSRMLKVPPAAATPTTESTELRRTRDEPSDLRTQKKKVRRRTRTKKSYSQVALAERLDAHGGSHAVSESRVASVSAV